MRIIPLWLFLVGICLGGGVHAQAPKVHPVKVVVEQSVLSVTPGDTFDIGVLFTMEEGWHVYWKDPGDAGLPTKITFQGSEELGFGDLQWPKHEVFDQSGGLKGNGYSRKVLLFAGVSVADDAQVGTEAQIEIEAAWLACSKKLCIPKQESFQLSVPIQEQTTHQNRELFERWRKRVP